MLKKKKKEDMEHTELHDELSAEETLNNEETAEETAATHEVKDGPTAEDKLKEEVAQANDKYLRLYAEFDNFRRRTRQERADERKEAGKEAIVALLPVLDDFERAEKAMQNATDVNAVKEGVALIQNKLKNILTQKGLKEMEAKGTTFDADIHEAITSIPAPTDDLKGKVVDELEKGYYLNDKVVRFAKVVVGA
ncbi:nucleotide exchange factor GrpE [Mucilaginibacter mali]|uniref:Protein GrpE n=2 Tax=Mucilaginibacter mali TaxID=2740462 RepID=A0A7D4QIZ8_9SPHI|nr:nucleotide exchange factor GrpE [Mucilaginibacter mali]